MSEVHTHTHTQTDYVCVCMYEQDLAAPEIPTGSVSFWIQGRIRLMNNTWSTTARNIQTIISCDCV